MSVQTQIDRIKGNVTRSLAKIAERGVMVPADANSDNLEELIGSIPKQPVPYTDITNMHIWEKYIIHSGKYIETPVNDVMITSYLSSSTASVDTNISYGDKIDVIDGVISFVNEKTVTYNNTDTENEIISKLSVIKDNFVKTTTNKYYFIPEDAVLSISYGSGDILLTKQVISNIANQITVNDYQPKFVSLVGSPYITTYPTNGEKDGYKYIYVGNLSDILDSRIITKTGTTTSHVIDTGLSSIEEFVIYKESLNTTGLIHLHYSKNDGTSYLYASAWSTNSWGTKTINNGTTAATVSGGSITLPSSTATSGGLSDGVTYTWVAVGTE